MAGSQSGLTVKRPGSRPFTNGAVINTKTLCCGFLSFQPGKIVLHDLKLKAERILAHKKLHLTQLGVQLLGCSSQVAVFERLVNPITSAAALAAPG